MKLWIAIAFVLYLILLMAIGILSTRKNASASDYFLGSRNIGAWTTAFSASASDMSGWLLMGLPGSIYAFGTNQAWIAVGLFIGTVLNWVIVASRLRKYTIRANDSLTIPEFLSNRFNDRTQILKIISAIVIAFFFTLYAASAFSAIGKFFSTVLNIDYHLALVIGAFSVLLYTFLGGYFAVCQTDVLQGLIMLAGIISVPILAAVFMGKSHIVPNLVDSNLGMRASDYLNVFSDADGSIKATSVISQLSWGLGYCGMPHILVRFMSAKNEKELSKSRKIAIVWALLALLVACIIGVLGRAYLYPTVLSNSGAQYENVYIEMIMKMFVNETSFPFIAGILLCGILAAIMSTADSQLLVSSSSVSQDLCKTVFRKNVKDVTLLMIGRVSVLLITVIAVLIAWKPDASIMKLVSNAWAGLGAAFGPTILLSLYWKRMNLKGAFAGMISGSAVVILWDYLKIIKYHGSYVTLSTCTGIYSLLIGFFVSLICIILVSLLTKKPNEEIINQFNDVNNGMI